MLTIEYAKDPFYNDSNNETVFLTVKFEEIGEELPFTATPYDDMPYGRELCADAKLGKFGVVRPYEENPNYIPPQEQPTTSGTQTI